MLDNNLCMLYTVIMSTIIIREIPEKLHRDFKRFCFDAGKSMNQTLKELMDKAIREIEKKQS